MPDPAPQTVIYILSSVHHVLKAEKILKKAGLEFDLIPVPKEVNPDCGLAVETSPDQAETVRQALLAANLKIEAAYRREGRSFSPQA